MPMQPGEARLRPNPGFAEFVILIALMMSLTAFSIDNLLPAFVPIGRNLAVADENRLQLIVTAYMVGFAVMQLVYGPLSDAIGRRPTLFTGLVIYILGSAAAMFVPDFDWLLGARFVQGLGAASIRVLSVAVVRDRFEGRQMARVMSLVMMVFLITPTVAPAIGAFILTWGSWRMIFAAMLLLAVIIAVWYGSRMPETLHPQYRTPLSVRAVLGSFRTTILDRTAIGYATALGAMMGCIMTYVGSAQPIFETHVFGLGSLFPVVFAGLAIAMAAAALANSMLVQRFGMRALAHGALLAFVVVTGIQLGIALAYAGRPPLALFLATMAGAHFMFSICAPNFNSMAMERLGAIAGTASSFIGFYTTLVGAVIGFLVGQLFDGTVLPLSGGYFAMGLISVGVVLWTEGGRLFRARHAGQAAKA